MFVTASAGQAREQLACGARVIGPLGSGLDADAVRAELEAARTASPLSLTEIRARAAGRLHRATRPPPG